jgi:hypothetical protein
VWRAVTLLVLAAAAPLGAWVGALHHADLQTAAAEHPPRRVAATLVAVPAPGTVMSGGPALATATWRVADGRSTTRVVPLPDGAQAGDVVDVVTDASGEVLDPPSTPRELVLEAVVAGAAAFAGVLGAAWAAHALAGRALGRCRAREWEDEWAAVEPGWSRPGR